MQLPRLDKRTAALLGLVGAGRRLESDGGSITLRCREAGVATGQGMMLGASLAGQPLLLWCDEKQWCDWIAPQLRVPNCAAIPAELHAVLAAWTLAEAGACGGEALRDTGLDWPAGETLKVMQLPYTPAWVMHFEQHGRRLEAGVVKAPLDWLEKLAGALMPVPAQRPGMCLPFPLVAGWTHVSARQLDGLAVGDALLLTQSYRADQGQVCLFIDKPVARLVMHPYGESQIEEVMENFDDWLDVTPTAGTADRAISPPADTGDALAGEPQTAAGETEALGRSEGLMRDAMLTIVAEAATYELPLGAVLQLMPGKILTGTTKSDGRISLKVNGKLIGHGTLLDIEGRLAVRVDSLA